MNEAMAISAETLQIAQLGAMTLDHRGHGNLCVMHLDDGLTE